MISNTVQNEFLGSTVEIVNSVPQSEIFSSAHDSRLPNDVFYERGMANYSMVPPALWSYRHLNTKNQRESRHIITTHNDNRGGKPFWETIFVSATHCGAGCTLGDIVSEWVVFIAGTTVAGVMLFASYVFDFALAWFIGIIFQYLAIVQMRLISLETALKEAIKADTLSLVMFEIGIFGWMALVAFVLIGNLYPGS